MSTMPTLQEILDAATIDPQVGAVRRLGPDVQVARRLVRAG